MADTFREWLENIGGVLGVLFAIVAIPLALQHFFLVALGGFTEHLQKCGVAMPGPLFVLFGLVVLFSPIVIVAAQQIVSIEWFGDWTDITRRAFIGVLLGALFGYELWMAVTDYHARRGRMWGSPASYSAEPFYDSGFCNFTRAILPDGHSEQR